MYKSHCGWVLLYLFAFIWKKLGAKKTSIYSSGLSHLETTCRTTKSSHYSGECSCIITSFSPSTWKCNYIKLTFILFGIKLNLTPLFSQGTATTISVWWKTMRGGTSVDGLDWIEQVNSVKILLSVRYWARQVSIAQLMSYIELEECPNVFDTGANMIPKTLLALGMSMLVCRLVERSTTLVPRMNLNDFVKYLTFLLAQPRTFVSFLNGFPWNSVQILISPLRIK